MARMPMWPCAHVAHLCCLLTSHGGMRHELMLSTKHVQAWVASGRMSAQCPVRTVDCRPATCRCSGYNLNAPPAATRIEAWYEPYSLAFLSLAELSMNLPGLSCCTTAELEKIPIIRMFNKCSVILMLLVQEPHYGSHWSGLFSTFASMLRF